jgi:hypothetical protein
MKFLFMQGKRSKAIHGELSAVLGEAAVRLTAIKRWYRRFKDGNFSLDDEFRSGRRRSDSGAAISRFLSATDRANQVVDARTLFQALRNDQSQNFSHIMTGDETWFYYNYEPPTIFARARDEVVPRVSPTIGSKKVIVTIFFTANRLVTLVYLPRGQKYNKEYFINEILEGINQQCNHGTRYRVTKTMKIHMDKCRVHDSWKHCRQFAE